jgi:hypothetical protein
LWEHHWIIPSSGTKLDSIKASWYSLPPVLRVIVRVTVAASPGKIKAAEFECQWSRTGSVGHGLGNVLDNARAIFRAQCHAARLSALTGSATFKLKRRLSAPISTHWPGANSKCNFEIQSY